MKTQHRVRVLFVIALLGGHLSAGAATVGGVNIHGFGGWAYGKTDNMNRYLVGNEDGNYANVDFALNLTANPYEKLSLHIQPSYTETSDGNEVGLDYAFAEVALSEAATVRIGKIKVPFMLYTEVYKVGTLRPFFTLPQGVYYDATAEAYKGLGLTGALYTSAKWEILYDVYGGKISLQPSRIPGFQQEQFVINDVYASARDIIGGRLLVHTPIEGLSVGSAAYRGDLEFAVNGYVLEDYPVAGKTLFVGAFAEYLSDRWWVRSEVVGARENPGATEDIVYGEVAYKLTSHWQVAARYEFVEMHFKTPEFLQFLPKAGDRHKEVALGINYWLNPAMVCKLSYHLVDGNRFANPDKSEDFLAVIQEQAYDETTQLVIFGVQFSF
jgi:hypothetical protein